MNFPTNSSTVFLPKTRTLGKMVSWGQLVFCSVWVAFGGILMFVVVSAGDSGYAIIGGLIILACLIGALAPVMLLKGLGKKQSSTLVVSGKITGVCSLALFFASYLSDPSTIFNSPQSSFFSWCLYYSHCVG